MLAAGADAMSKWFGAAEASPEDEDEMFKRFTIDQNKKYGEGGYGATFAAQDTKTGQAAAVKVIDTRRMRLEAIRKECSILEGLVHSNVITLLGHGSGRKSSGQAHLYFIFMEVASGGELFDQVIDRGANAMSEATGRKFMSQLLAGVHHCHSRGVAHRDLKLENVLLTKDGVVKVIDFGLSHIYAKGGDGEFDRSVLLKEMCGSKSYAAPEVLSGVGYDGFLADVWSLGVCLFAMLSGFFPLDEASPNDWRFGKLMEQQAKGRSTTKSVYAWYKRSCAHLSVPVVQLLDGMLAVDPHQRMTMRDVLTHPWLREEIEVAMPGYSRGDADQGSYNLVGEVGDDEGPRYRGAFVMGPVVPDDTVDDMDYSEPVYRSLGFAEPSEVTHAVLEGAIPGLKKQKAFGDAASLWA
jgi:serine/threonine protein kinase